MFTTFTAYRDTTGTGFTETLTAVETFDAESVEQAVAILTEAGYTVLDNEGTDLLVTSKRTATR